MAWKALDDETVLKKQLKDMRNFAYLLVLTKRFFRIFLHFPQLLNFFEMYLIDDFNVIFTSRIYTWNLCSLFLPSSFWHLSELLLSLSFCCLVSLCTIFSSYTTICSFRQFKCHRLFAHYIRTENYIALRVYTIKENWLEPKSCSI